MVYSIWIEDIEGIDQSEKKLAEHIDDFSKLDSDWKLDFLYS